jgi:hypothetical protein
MRPGSRSRRNERKQNQTQKGADDAEVHALRERLKRQLALLADRIAQKRIRVPGLSPEAQAEPAAPPASRESEASCSDLTAQGAANRRDSA